MSATPLRYGYASYAYTQLSSIGRLPMINLKAEGQQQQQLRTSALRLIVLTHVEKRFKSGRLKG